MFDNFYTTVAQILPVLLLAFLWDSGFLGRLRDQPRRTRRLDPHGVRFWTKPRVRAYSLTVVTVIIGAMAAAVLVLAGFVADSILLRTAVVGAVALALATLLFRLIVDIILATTDHDQQ